MLRDILANLYYPESPYEFSVLPADILGQIYERFLGKTITLTAAHHARIEEKPHVRKAGGVYYTPTYVVRYIVENTVGQLLRGPAKSALPVSEAANVKVLDPACGSGSFLIAAYQYLLDWHLARYVEKPEYHSRGKNPRIYQSAMGAYRLTTSERKRILLNNIYGVDIDPQAVEVTKLSLLLKVLEGETEQILQRDWLKERERILPDLAGNVRCGNSLIGPEFYDDPEMLLLDEDVQYRVNAFDWSGAFPDIMESGGFHCVIANPPYGAALGTEEKTFLAANYNCQSYQLDSYLLFLEQSLTKLQRPGGNSGFIIPNPWLTNLKQPVTRKFVCGAASIEQIVHFTFPVFKAAVVDTEIVLFSTPLDLTNRVTVFICPAVDPGGKLQLSVVATHDQSDWIGLDGGVINIFMTPRDKQLFAKINKQSKPLEHWFEINVGVKPYQKGKGNPPQSADTVVSRPFDSTFKRDDTYRELLRGGDINPYVITPTDKRFISYGPWLAEPRPAAAFDVPEKILMRQTGDRPIAGIDTLRRLAMNNVHVVAPRDGLTIDLKYFVGILNSSLATWFYRCLTNRSLS